MITYESESALFESSAPMIVPMLIWQQDGDLRIEVYDGVREVAEEFERRFARHPFSKSALDWLDEQLAPYCNRHGYYRETQGKYRWYRQFTYNGESEEGLVLSSTFRWEGEPNLSGLLLDLDPDWLTYVTVEDGVIVSAARVNEYDPDQSSPEITVETAVEYRGRGYGVSNVLALARALAEGGERAQYVCSRYNRGSAKLALRAGFAETGRFYAYTAYRD